MESNSEQWLRISRLFDDLADLNPQQRRERLSQIGADDPGIRAAVESLLEADAEADERLSRFDVGVSRVIRTSTLGIAADSGDPLGIIGKTVGQFRVRAFLATGGMGVVYEADDARLSRSVALKFPLPHHQVAERVKARFIREAQAAGALDHINLCPVYEVGESVYGLFLAMPLYRGKTLKQLLVNDGPLPVPQALGIARQLAAGLSHAHAAGIVHRDLKPANVMLLPDGTAKILDFGLARTQDVSQTKSEVTLGTVSYMAPEQIRGAKVDARTDLWSLGVILYETLAGERPFTGDREAAVAHAILHSDPKPLPALRPELPPAVQELVRSLLQKDTSVRYPSAQKVLGDIDDVARGLAPAFRPAFGPRVMAWTRRRRLPLTIGAVVAATGGMVAGVPRLQARLSKPTSNEQAYDFYQRAREYERFGSPAAAESLYLRAIALDSSFALARARLAIVYAECQAGGSRDCFRRPEERPADRLEEIRRTAEAALRQQPRLADAHFALGLYWERQGDPERSIAEYELALPGMRKSGPLHAAWARAYRTQGQWDRAIRELERAIELDPADVASMAELATTYSRLRQYDVSARWWNQYLARAPDAYEGAIIKGNVYLRWLGTLDTLVAIYNGLPEQRRSRAYGTRFLMARLGNRLQDAIAVLDQWPARTPEDTTGGSQFPPLLRAQVYADMGDSARARAWFDSARIALEQLAQRRPGSFRPQVSLGLAYAGLGRAGDAKRAADSALALMPFTRNVILGPVAMKGAAEIYAQVPAYRHLAIALLDSLLRIPAGREVSVPLLRMEPQWAPLRDNPAFRALLTRYTPR